LLIDSYLAVLFLATEKDYFKPYFFILIFKKRKIKRTIKNATATNPKIIAKSENKFLNISLFEKLYRTKEIKDMVINKTRFFKTKLIFFLLGTNFLLVVFFEDFFFTPFFLSCYLNTPTPLYYSVK